MIVCQIQGWNRFQFFQKGSLFRFFDSIGIQRVGKISFPMPEVALPFHSFCQKILFDSKRPVREKNPQLPIVQSSIQVLTDFCSTGIDPEPYGFKPVVRSLPSQGPPHLRLTQVLLSRTQKVIMHWNRKGLNHRPKGSSLFPTHQLSRSVQNRSQRVLQLAGLVLASVESIPVRISLNPVVQNLLFQSLHQDRKNSS